MEKRVESDLFEDQLNFFDLSFFIDNDERKLIVCLINKKDNVVLEKFAINYDDPDDVDYYHYEYKYVNIEDCVYECSDIVIEELDVDEFDIPDTFENSLTDKIKKAIKKAKEFDAYKTIAFLETGDDSSDSISIIIDNDSDEQVRFAAFDLNRDIYVTTGTHTSYGFSNEFSYLFVRDAANRLVTSKRLEDFINCYRAYDENADDEYCDKLTKVVEKYLKAIDDKKAVFYVDTFNRDDSSEYGYGGRFDKSLVISAILNNDCSFSKYVVDTCIDRVRYGSTKLIPGNSRVPKNMNFVDKQGNKYYARIEQIIVQEKTKLNDLVMAPLSECNVGVSFEVPNTKYALVFLLGYINESSEDRNIMFYEGKKVNGTIFNTYNNISILLLNFGQCELKSIVKSDLGDNLISYLKYYSKLLDELNGKKDFINLEIDIDLLRDYYDVFVNLVPDEDLITLPVKGSASRIPSISLTAESSNGKFEKYDFYEAKIETYSKDDLANHLSTLIDNGITIPKNDSLVLLDVIDLHDEDKFLFRRLLTSGNIDKCVVTENIEGDRTRIRRVISGIENALSDQVANKSLVKTICTNDIMSRIPEFATVKKYKEDTKVVEYLKKEYPVLNIEQVNAVSKILQMDQNDIDIMLVQGPPGTGKTELILSLARELTKNNYSTLITSNVHVACDNVVERLKNYKDIVLKRYTAIRGDQYEQEIIKNQKYYVKNQVLAGFEYKDQIVFKQDTYNEIIQAKNDLLARKEQMLIAKKDYDDKLSEYNKLLSEKTSLEEKITTILKDIDDLSESIKKQEADLSALEKSKKGFETEFDGLDELHKKAEAHLQDLINESESLKKEINDLYAEIDKSYADIKSAKQHIEELHSLISQTELDVEQNKDYLSFLTNISVDELKESAVLYATNNVEFKTKYHRGLLSKCLQKVMFLVNLKKALEKDTSFWNNGEFISNSTLELLFFKLSKDPFTSSFLTKDSLDSLSIIYAYQKASSFKKKLMKMFGFVKVKGKNNKEIIAIREKLNRELKEIQFNFEEYVSKIIEEYKVDDDLAEATRSTKALLVENQTKIEESKKEIEKTEIAIDDAKRLISSDNGKINTRTKKLSDVNSGVESEKTNIEELEKRISACKAQIEKFVGEIETSKNKLSETKGAFENKDAERNSANQELSNLNDSIKTLTENLGDLIINYESFVNRFNIDLKNVETKIDNLNRLIALVKQKITTLTENGWTEEEAVGLLSSYTAELQKIIDCPDEKVTNYFTGRGSIFTNMFLLTGNSEGSLISMTTNQVASLLYSVEKDELTFDYAIVDEASKCKFEDLIISLPRIRHLVLIGDFMQLDPMFEDYSRLDLAYQNILKIDEWESLNRSSFSMLLSQFVNFNFEHRLKDFDSNPCVAIMKRQYRMNKDIFELIKPVYSIHDGFELIDEKKMTSNDLMCIDIDGVEVQQGGKSYSNEDEGNAIIDFLKQFKDNREKYKGIKTVGVITGYRAQQNYMNRKLKGFNIPGVQIRFGTFDRFQGREFDLVLVSLVRTVRLGFTNNVRRMNVAFSRAKSHLIVFGNFEALLSIARKSYKPTSEDVSNADAKETNFVINTLIPTLYDKKKKFVSTEECTKAILEFLKEEDYE